MADDTPATPPPAVPPPASDLAQPAAKNTATVRLAVPWPHTTFDHGVEGAPPISNTGTDVPVGLVKRVQGAWHRAFGLDEIEPTDNELLVIDQEA